MSTFCLPRRAHSVYEQMRGWKALMPKTTKQRREEFWGQEMGRSGVSAERRQLNNPGQ
jgi:hypothetical protein